VLPGIDSLRAEPAAETVGDLSAAWRNGVASSTRRDSSGPPPTADVRRTGLVRSLLGARTSADLLLSCVESARWTLPVGRVAALTSPAVAH